MLIRTKWRFWSSWRHLGCTLWRSQLLCSRRNFYFLSLFAVARRLYGKDYYKAFEGDVWVYHLCGIFDTINHSCNFFLYVISGSLFRQEFIAMIRCKTLKERISIGFSNYSATNSRAMETNFSTPFVNRTVKLSVRRKLLIKANSSQSLLTVSPQKCQDVKRTQSLRNITVPHGSHTLLYQTKRSHNELCNVWSHDWVKRCHLSS